MKKITLFFVLVLCVATVFGQHRFEFGDVSLDDKKEIIKVLDNQIKGFKKELKKEAKVIKKNPDASSMMYEFYLSEIIKLEKDKLTYLGRMVEDSTNNRVESTGMSAYGSAYLYSTIVRVNGKDTKSSITAFTPGGTMKVLLMNNNKYRHHSAQIYEVRANPEWQKGNFGNLDYKKVKQVASVLLPSEGKAVVDLVPGYYVVEFYYNKSTPEYVHGLYVDPTNQVWVPDDYVQGLNITASQLNGYVIKN